MEINASEEEVREAMEELIAGLRSLKINASIPRAWGERRDQTLDTLEGLLTLLNAGRIDFKEAALSATKVMDEYVDFISEEREDAEASEKGLPAVVSRKVTA